MVDAAPFRALRYDATMVGDLAATSAPDYDDLDPPTYAHHRTASPYTVLELLSPPDTRGSYEAVGASLRRWRRTGILRQDAVAAFYRYEEHELRHGVPAVQRGLLAAVALPGTGTDREIATHEAVDPARVADRLARLEALRVDVSPIVALATDPPVAFREHLAHAPRTAPVAAFTDEAGVDHRLWPVSDAGEVAALRDALRGVRVLIADGHHRYAAALAARGRHRGERWQRTLMYVVDASSPGPQVRAVHRLVRGVGEHAISRLRADYVVDPAPADSSILQGDLPAEAGAFGLLVAPALAEALGSIGAHLRPRDVTALTARLPADRPPQWHQLDTAVLDHAVLPGLDIGHVEPRADLARAAADVASSRDAALFVLRPVALTTIEALATAGEHLPRKSTYFRPKPRAGLVLRPVDDSEAPHR